MAEPLNPQTRNQIVLAVLLIFALGYLGYNYVYKPRTAEVTALEARLASLRTQNETARSLTQQQGRSEVERRLARYSDQLDRVEGLIPSSEELPDLLDAISAEARRTGVELTLIQPVGATAETYYTRRVYDMAVLGSYHQIGTFLAEIASLPRIVTPTNLEMTLSSDTTGMKDPELDARFAIETYVLPTILSSDTSDAH